MSVDKYPSIFSAKWRLLFIYPTIFLFGIMYLESIVNGQLPSDLNKYYC